MSETLVTTTHSIPSYLEPHSGVGTEHLTADDVAMPRLSLAQAMSDQVNATHADHIEGLKVGDFFNSVSGVVYGTKITFSLLVSYPPRAIEFSPMEQGGGVVDPNVPLTDPRLQFGADGSAPQATKFYDYIVMLSPGESEEMIAMSLARSGIKAAKSLNGLVQMRGTAIFTGLYTAESVAKNSQQGSYMSWRFRNAGFIPEALVARYAELHAGLKSQTLTTDDAPVVETPF